MEEKPQGYYENINLNLLNAIPLEAEVVLEIGCASGGLGAEYKKKNPACTYYGVEVDAPSAATAAERLDKVFCGPVEEADLAPLKGTVDCVVYGDVLEHLIDPWAVLKSHAALLKKGGRIAACIPNIQHWTLLHHLLNGNWVYHDHGLLDRTHLRFFTLSTINEMFVTAGLQVENIIGLQVNHEITGTFVERMRPALINLGIDVDNFTHRCAPLQYLVVASRVN